MVPNPAPNFSFLGFSSYPQWLRSPRDFTTAKRKYDDSATQQLPSSRRRSIRFSAPIIHSQSHDSGTAYNSLAPPVDEIEIAKQKAQEIAARLFNGAEAKRSKFENGGGFDSNDSKGFGSAPTFAVAASRDMGYILFMIKMQNQLDLIKLNSLSFVHKQEPALGINFARDGMPEKDWLALVAVHGDAWLLDVAFYFGARFGFDKADRKHLFSMINDLPTIFEVVSGAAKKLVKEKSTVSNNSIKKSKSNSKAKGLDPLKFQKPASPKDDDEEGLEEEDEEEEHGDTLSGSCGENYASDEFWICCDICEKWFHGVCVKITPTRAEHIKHYKCPACTTNKRAHP